MTAALQNNPMFLATQDLLDTLSAVTVHQDPETSECRQLHDLHNRLEHLSTFPDSASHFCKVINDQILAVGSRAISLGASMALRPHDSIDIAGEVQAAALCMAAEDISRYQKFAMSPEVEGLGWCSRKLLREAYGNVEGGGNYSAIEHIADVLEEIHLVTGGMTPVCLPDEALDLRRMEIHPEEGCPENPQSSLLLRYRMPEALAAHGDRHVEMVLPAYGNSFSGLNKRGFYTPDISHTEAVDAFRTRFYEGDVQRGLPPICKNGLEGAHSLLERAIEVLRTAGDSLSASQRTLLEPLLESLDAGKLQSEIPLKDMAVAQTPVQAP